ncbi:MAG: hypothetical protein WAV15_04300 [Minisyncoccia bacterium]
MKLRNLITALLVIMTVVFSFATFVVSGQERKLPTGVRKVTTSEIGKPGSGTRLVHDHALINRIMGEEGSRRNVASTNHNPSADPEFDGAIVKDSAYKVLSFVGHLHRFSVVVPILEYPTGKRFNTGAFSVEEEGDWFISFWYGEIPPMLTLEGAPTLFLRVFDPEREEMVTLSSDMNFYGSPSFGINEVQVSNRMKVITESGDARVLVNFYALSDESITRTPEGMEVELYNPDNGEGIIYEGDNLVTIVDGGGRCDTYLYRYNPSRGVTTTPIP